MEKNILITTEASKIVSLGNIHLNQHSVSSSKSGLRMETFEHKCCLSATQFFIRSLTQGLIPKVPYFWASNGQIVVLKVL